MGEHHPPQFTKDSIATPEMLHKGIGVEIRVMNDFTPVLDALNTSFGTHLSPRNEGHHITIITPREKNILHSFTGKELTELTDVYKKMSAPGGIAITGVGYIDGSKRSDILEKDKTKKAAYVALNIPSLQEFRSGIGLPEKDFHVTLGLEGDDIHDHIMPGAAEGSWVVSVIPKKADPALQPFAPDSLKLGELYVLQSLKPYKTAAIT